MPLTEEQQETIVNSALDIFVEYLNLWMREGPVPDPDTHLYTREMWTTTDHDRDLYGECRWKELDPEAYPDSLVKITCSDGDDGGPNELYVGIEYGGYTDETHRLEDVRVHWIVQVFDTTPTLIYEVEKGILHKPETTSS
jgi:hypothetical protein